MKNYLFVILVLFIPFSFYSTEKTSIDWINGKIFSSVSFSVKNDYNFAHNRIKELDSAKEKAKTNFSGILKKINIYESTSILEYIESYSNKSDLLFSLFDNAKLSRIEYPDLNTIRVTYSIDIYGNDSLSSILVPDDDSYVENIKSFVSFNYDAKYTGLIIDARGDLESFDGQKVNVKPCIFVTIKDSKGSEILNRYNIFPNVIKNKGMVGYSYNINDKRVERVGNKPLKILAYGTGDKSGSIIVISEPDAKKILSSEETRKSIQNGNILVVINP